MRYRSGVPRWGPASTTLAPSATVLAVAPLLATAERASSDTLTFEYRVQDGDHDADALKLNGGSIHDTAGNSAALSHDVVVAGPAHMVTAATSD